ncbi:MULTISPECIES: sugar ABC transporter substrate-binding protein [unclassified Streptomyces]|uniref:sugar ABC transporter substrate-binding protein n=1 Tax=unclassified Streptomyces TaxID=2593676 RepID=UPI002254B847|nr:MULTISPECIES: substrate-binding domain-containing protein [unclassified Streptomyces]MCX4878837.1 substrate-binding domain-containing protein [Streptomyces sp. NBC_00847]MCX5418801.1 substrate-binding domain-containing protein [Streptomyces sp. NBC_00078]
MRTRGWQAVAALVAALMTMSQVSCGKDGNAGKDGFAVGLLLPSRTVPRWEHSDKPLIQKRIKELCPRCTMEYANAEDDADRQRQQVTSMITKGVKVIILDAADTKALRSSTQEAHRAGVPVVAYDRLAQGPVSGYVSFDGGQVGRLQGRALLKAMGEKAAGEQVVMLNGDPTSPNAAWYRSGALSVIAGKVKIGRSYDTQGWSTDNAHANMSAAIEALGPGRIGGVLAANDEIAAGAISALKRAGVRPLPPVTGQDADLDAVRRIVAGEQYMTVYKPFGTEAAAAAAMAVTVGRGDDLRKVADATTDSPTTRNIPSVLLTPSAVTVRDVKRILVDGGEYTVDEICTREYRHACEKAGLTP